jgi:glutathione S-transferase
VTATLVGQLDSPYVRRVAVSAALLDIGFELRPWSVGADQARLREVNPLGRVPAWIADDGQVLVDSAQIVDHLDDLAGFGRALMPGGLEERFVVRQWLGLLTGVLDKGIAINIERIFNAVPAQSTAWTQRCRGQLDSGLAEVERRCAAARNPWLAHHRMTQADVAFACFLTYLRDSVPLDLAPFPHLVARLEAIEALPAFSATYTPFEAPVAPRA